MPPSIAMACLCVFVREFDMGFMCRFKRSGKMVAANYSPSELECVCIAFCYELGRGFRIGTVWFCLKL